MGSRSTLTGTPADLISYQNELIRTKNYTPLGRANKIAIGPSRDWNAADYTHDPFIQKFGRLIDLRNRWLPLAMSPDRSMLLVTAPLVARSIETGEILVGLPDVPDPNAKAIGWSHEDMGYRLDGSPLNEKYPGQPKDWTPEKGRVDLTVKATPMIPQRLEDRAEHPNGRLGVLEGTNFLVFQPVLNIAYQPEIIQDGAPKLQAAVWIITCMGPDGSLQLDEQGRNAVLLVDPRTGEAHFMGGRYDIVPTE